MVRNASYLPDRGDIVFLTFEPHEGHEQSGRRPAIVISPRAYNSKVGFALFCPITSRIKGYPFEVQLPEKGVITGVILSDQVKSLDWCVRSAEFVCKIHEDVIFEVLEKIRTLID
jgi:mRNA interferase MazF